MIDNIGFFILSRAHTETFYRDIFIMIILVPLLKYIYDNIYIYYIRLRDFLLGSYKNKIEFVGWESINGGLYYYDYPVPMTAICHYITMNNISNNLRYFTPSRNGTVYSEDIKYTKKDKNIAYLVNFGNNIKIKDDLFLDYSFNKLEVSKESKCDNSWKVTIILKSKYKSINEINDFINNCIKSYDNYIDEKSKDKIYHFIYQGKDSNKRLTFSMSVLSDLSDPNKMCYETFDNIHSEHKTMLIRDLERLKDINYYKKTGNKRKKGYLFYGPPGCGKTSSVIAMALHDKRHILEVSMSRIKTNEELEQLFNTTEIMGIKFEKSQLILLFDEIDTGSKVLAKRKGEDNSDSNELDHNKLKDEIIANLIAKRDDCEKNYKLDNDEIHLGCVLSRFDGVGSYNGLVIIATTNCKEKLSPALYRNGRLNPVFFEYVDKTEIKNMIEKYYNINLSSDEIHKLPNKLNKLSHSTIKKYIEDYDNDYNELIKFLHSISSN